MLSDLASNLLKAAKDAGTPNVVRATVELRETSVPWKKAIEDIDEDEFAVSLVEQMAAAYAKKMTNRLSK